MSTTASGARLNWALASDIEFLSSFFTDLCTVLKGKWTSNLEWRGLYAMKGLLSEILSRENAQQEPHTSQQRELDLDIEDETWVEDWEVQELLAWMLLETRAAGLPEESQELHHLVEQLEQRLTVTPTALSKSSSADVTPSASGAETSVLTEPKQCHRPDSFSLLPTELLCKIFESICTPRSPLSSPLILSHVDSHFRSVALDMPSLWSTIDNIVPLPIAKLYLERSIGAPLDVRIGPNGPPALEDDKSVQLFYCLEPHAHRVKDLKIVADDLHVMIGLEESMDCGELFGGLEKLEFGLCGDSQPNGYDLPFRLAEPSSLRELRLWGYTLDRWIDTFPTFLRRLRLSEVDISFKVLAAALERSPDLSVLVLEDCILSGYAKKALAAGRLVDLQFIRIALGDMVQLAGLIRTPALASLSVVGPSSTANTEFLVNLAKSSKEILFVEICDYDLTENDWLAIFKHLPNLTYLRVRASYSSDQDLQALTITQTLPNLTSITLDNEFRLSTLLVEQIARAHPKLESIVLRGWDPSNVSAESLVEISKLVKNIYVETFGTSPEEDGGEDTESDSNDDFSSEGSWLSGDEHVAMNAQKYIYKPHL
ncbi:hypothetical protein M407DRAFT_23776 [Tulasnella calospora MUT 4182]|uniref:Uncharacterized protein n=1 Tax=Tulasnella calospora MUT 4182 TaxID=1051891 RepID=A0A0C3QIZ8_9AGAM|nr:hypothetical protein M407DRAFT_23776 [Tulasnella calospora MUT 4182]